MLEFMPHGSAHVTVICAFGVSRLLSCTRKLQAVAQTWRRDGKLDTKIVKFPLPRCANCGWNECHHAGKRPRSNVVDVVDVNNASESSNDLVS
jgi:predicted alpha/beta-hydrolase family hydrolase